MAKRAPAETHRPRHRRRTGPLHLSRLQARFERHPQHIRQSRDRRGFARFCRRRDPTLPSHSVVTSVAIRMRRDESLLASSSRPVLSTGALPPRSCRRPFRRHRCGPFPAADRRTRKAAGGAQREDGQPRAGAVPLREHRGVARVSGHRECGDPMVPEPCEAVTSVGEGNAAPNERDLRHPDPVARSHKPPAEAVVTGVDAVNRAAARGEICLPVRGAPSRIEPSDVDPYDGVLGLASVLSKPLPRPVEYPLAQVYAPWPKSGPGRWWARTFTISNPNKPILVY
jgi:hypothetical protein